MQETIEYMSRTGEGVVDVVGYKLLQFSIDMTVAQKLAALSKFPKCLVLPIISHNWLTGAHLLLTGKIKANSKCVWSVAHTPKPWLAALVFRGRGVRGFWLLHFKFGVDSSSFLFEELFGGVMLRKEASEGGFGKCLVMILSQLPNLKFLVSLPSECFAFQFYYQWKLLELEENYTFFVLWFLWIDDC